MTAFSFIGRVFIALFLLGIFGCAHLSSSDPHGLNRIGSFEDGTLYRTPGKGGAGQFNVLVLKGSWREMGRQYGYLLKDPMNELYETAVTQYLVRTKGITYAEVKEASEEIYAQQFPYMCELIAGMTETSGFSLEKQKIVSALVHLMDLSPGCSSMAAWGTYTGGGALVLGRNWDIGGPYREYKKYLSVVIYCPMDWSNALADINFLGTLSLQTGMTRHGIFLDLQNGQRSDPKEVASRRMPTFDLFDFLINTSTIEDLNARMLDPANLPALSLIINVADAKEDRVYEWATYDVRRRTGNGLIVSTNHFVDPAWTNLPPVPPGAQGDYSRERLANLLALGECHKGTIDAAKMMQIFDTTFLDDGPTFPEYTVYQVVAVPAELTIWLKARDYSEWERIPLGSLFREMDVRPR